VPRTVDEAMDKTILDGPNSEMFRQVRDLVDNGAREIRQRVDDAVRIAEETGSGLAARVSHVLALHLKQEKAYQDLLELRAKEKDQATERDKLLRRQSELRRNGSALRNAAKTFVRRSRPEPRCIIHGRPLRRLSDLKDARFGHRMAVAQKLTSQLGPTILVQIEQYGNTDAYRDVFWRS
jgi:hypothetical protein